MRALVRKQESVSNRQKVTYRLSAVMVTAGNFRFEFVTSTSVPRIRPELCDGNGENNRSLPKIPFAQIYEAEFEGPFWAQFLH